MFSIHILHWLSNAIDILVVSKFSSFRQSHLKVKASARSTRRLRLEHRFTGPPMVGLAMRLNLKTWRSFVNDFSLGILNFIHRGLQYFRARSTHHHPPKCCHAEILYMSSFVDRSIPRWMLAKLVAGWTKPDPVNVD